MSLLYYLKPLFKPRAVEVIAPPPKDEPKKRKPKREYKVEPTSEGAVAIDSVPSAKDDWKRREAEAWQEVSNRRAKAERDKAQRAKEEEARKLLEEIQKAELLRIEQEREAARLLMLAEIARREAAIKEAARIARKIRQEKELFMLVELASHD